MDPFRYKDFSNSSGNDLTFGIQAGIQQGWAGPPVCYVDDELLVTLEEEKKP